MNFLLETENLLLETDASARLLRLVDRATGHTYAAGQGLWRLYYQIGQRFQSEVLCTDQTARIERDGQSLRLIYDALASDDGQLKVRLVIAVSVVGDETRWSATIENHDPRIALKELQFPLVGKCDAPDGHELITTANGGTKYPSAEDFVRGQYPPRYHAYCNEDFNGLQAHLIYPSISACSNCFVLAGKGRGLYVASHDPTFRNTVHLFRLRGNDLEIGLTKHLFLQPGQRLTIDGYVVSPYTGTWHVAADKYRAWADTWFKPIPKPAWIENFHGWQRLIMKHQNGQVLFPYDAMPRIFADGKKAGVDTLFMFAWWPGGMDRMYPDYVPDPELGGEAKLRENIKRFQDDLGGNIILYASGRLVDRESAFYKEHGRELTIKTRTGAEVRDAYLFGNRSTFERLYGAVELTAMCLDCERWVKVLEHVIDLAVEYGCKGVFFDQLGTLEYPCCDPNHGHPVPYVTQIEGKRRVIQRLRDYARSKDPQLAFGVEIFADAVGQFFDFHHGLYFQNYIATNADYREKGEKPQTLGFVDWMRYVYPNVIISDRDIRDENDFERRVNLALSRGLVHDVEIYRCRRTVAETPRYQVYLGQINALRDRHPDLLVRGTYRDTLDFRIDNDDIDARCFVNGDRLAVVLSQSHLPRAVAGLAVPGYRFDAADGMGEFQISADGAKIELGRHGVAVVIFRR